MSSAAQAKPARRVPRPKLEPRERRHVPDDAELFNDGLDFFFNVLDSVSGLRGALRTGDEAPSGSTQSIAYERMRTPKPGKPGTETTLWMHISGRKLSSKPVDTITDKQLDDIGFGRRVWSALTQLPWSSQQTLRRYYESPRTLAAMAGKGVSEGGGGLAEADVRRAHVAYLAAVAASAQPPGQPPVEIDRDVDGGVPDRAQYRERGEVPRTGAERKRAERARNKTWDDSSPLLERHDREDNEARAAERAVESLLDGLKAGANRFPSALFASLARYFLEPARRRAAIKRRKFRLTTRSVVIIEDVDMTGELVSLREYARRRGIPRSTLLYRADRLVHLGLASVKVGQEIRYDSDQLDRALAGSAPIVTRKHEHRSGD